MAQNNSLKAYSRLDGSGRIVPGTTVLRRKLPVTGSWVETPAYLCCGPSTFLSSTPADVTLSTVTFTLLCNDSTVATAVLTPATATVTIEDVVNVLNDKIGFYGLFSVYTTTDISLRLKDDIASALCSGTLSFTIS